MYWSVLGNVKDVRCFDSSKSSPLRALRYTKGRLEPDFAKRRNEKR
jgi:hypothetical protein